MFTLFMYFKYLYLMSEQTYELNNCGKCMNFICKFTYQCIILMFIIAFGFTGAGIILFMLASPFVYIYYVTQNNWNVMEKGDDDSSFITPMAKLGFIFICATIFVILLFFSVYVWQNCGLNDLYQSFKHATFYKKVITNQDTNVSNPVTNTADVV